MRPSCDGVVDLGRLELPTSRLSGVRSNLLSYRSICLSFVCITALRFLRSDAHILRYAPLRPQSRALCYSQNPAHLASCFPWLMRCYSAEPMLTYIGTFRFVRLRAPCIKRKILRFLRLVFLLLMRCYSVEPMLTYIGTFRFVRFRAPCIKRKILRIKQYIVQRLCSP